VFRHVLCVYPYRVGVGRSFNLPPLGLELIAAVLEPHAQAIDVVDLRLESGHAVDFLRPDTDLVCFSVNWAWETDFVRREVRSVRPDVLTIVGGRCATQDPQQWLADHPNVDILVRGDGEEAVEEIARGESLEGIAGISYRLDGRVVHNPGRHCAPVRDELYPNRNLRHYAYGIEVGGFSRLPLDTVASSRGCPFNCRFCSFSRNPWGSKRNWSARSPESVVRELAEIDAGIVFFVDDNFTHDMDRVGAICDLIVASGIRKRYLVNARVEIARRPDVLRKMERAGFSALLLGIESAHDKTLHSMRKGFDTRQLREYFRVLRKTRMLLHGYFIIGNIGETEEEMLEIAPFARELGVHTVSLCPLRNERYSGLEELVAESPGYHIGPDGKVYSDKYPQEHLRRIRDTVLRQFHRPGQVLGVLSRFLRNRLITPWIVARLPLALGRIVLGRRRRSKARLKRTSGDTGPPKR
jgi:anaerobic magnesium-protoporphyrin IX monomethyl ester cyclase